MGQYFNLRKNLSLKTEREFTNTLLLLVNNKYHSSVLLSFLYRSSTVTVLGRTDLVPFHSCPVPFHSLPVTNTFRFRSNFILVPDLGFVPVLVTVTITIFVLIQVPVLFSVPILVPIPVPMLFPVPVLATAPILVPVRVFFSSPKSFFYFLNKCTYIEIKNKKIKKNLTVQVNVTGTETRTKTRTETTTEMGTRTRARTVTLTGTRMGTRMRIRLELEREWNVQGSDRKGNGNTENGNDT